MDNRVAVLGAGPMGLGVAYQLVLDGYKPIVFEADDRIGGMTATFDFSGLDIERFYHFHCVSDHELLQILEELDISHKMCWTETKMGYWYQGRIQPWGNPLALFAFNGLGLTAKFRYGLHAFASTKRNDWRSLDNVEATKWIKFWVGSEAWEVLWRRLFDYKFYNHSTSLSAAWIWSRIRRIGRSRYNLFREKLGYLEGGSSTLLNALNAAILEGGGEIRLKVPVQKVIIKNDKVLGIQVAGQFEAFDKVISTIPVPYVSKVVPDLPGEIIEKFEEIQNIAVVCVIAKMKKSVSENFWLNINDPEMEIPGLVEYTNLQKLKEHVVYIPFYVPFDHPLFNEPDRNFLNKVRLYLKKINSNLKDDDFIEMRVSRYRHAQPICGPGFLEKLPPIDLPIDGLWVADTSYYYPEDRGISESLGLGRRIAKMATVPRGET